MGISIGHLCIEPEPYADLEPELLSYVQLLSEFPSMQALSELDPYGDAMLDAKALDGLRRELGQIKPRAKARTLPEPPKYVGLSHDVEPCSDDEFGWEGFERFLDELDEVLTVARQRKESVLAIGD